MSKTNRETRSEWHDDTELTPSMWEEMMKEVGEWLNDGETLAGYDDESDEGETA